MAGALRPPDQGSVVGARGRPWRYHRLHGHGLGRAWQGQAGPVRRNNEASEQGVEADEAGASDGASQLNSSVERTKGRPVVRVFQMLRRRVCDALGSSPTPGPDLTAAPNYPGETVVEVQYSLRQRNRTIITQDQQGHFHVHRQHWDASDWDVGGTPFWMPADGSATVTDTLERARVLANEALRGATDG
jgi:hypothetical protein